MWLGYGIAEAVARGRSSDLTPSLGTSIFPGCGPKKTKKKKKMLNTNLSHDLAIPLFTLYSREMKMCPRKDLYAKVHSIIIYNNEQVDGISL